MQPTRHRSAAAQLLLPLAVGAVTFAALWMLGAKEFGWLGFLTAGLAWSAVDRLDDRLDDRLERFDSGTHDGEEGALAGVAVRTPASARPIPPGRYALDPQRSSVRIRVLKLRLFPVRGRFTHVTGTLDVQEEPAQSRVTAAVASGSLRTGNPYRDGHVVGPALLDAARHPVLRFDGTPTWNAEQGTWAVTGAMTVKGVSRPVTFAVPELEWSGGRGRLRLVATTTLDRSRFGITAYGWLAGDEVHVRIEAEACETTPAQSGGG
jgi:polyisoprenoid-binding protein YceI